MTESVITRAKRTRVGRIVKRVVRGVQPLPPRVSVVVPFHDSVGSLAACLDSLLRQTYPNVEIVLVDDGSVDGSAEVAQRYAREHRTVVLVRQEHLGVGAARNRGIELATGDYLAFCDSDDTVSSQGYERLATSMTASGSDLAVGSLTLQTNGRHQEPGWARRSNARRTQGATLVEQPEIMANLMPGTRLLRRDFVERHALRFATEGDHSDVVMIVRALVLARTFDMIPAVVYRWHWREDGRSLWQRGLVDRDRVADRLARMREAGAIVVAEAPPEVQGAYFAEILHTVVPDLVRAAVTRSDGYWEALSHELDAFISSVPWSVLLRVPVEDRAVAVLCAQDQREATEQFLEYAMANPHGLPYEMDGDQPRVTLPAVDSLAAASRDLVDVAESELQLRTRLASLRWVAPDTLQLEGAAFVEYLADSYSASVVTVVLRDLETGQERRIETTPAPDVEVNQWAQRDHEDHTGGAFRCRITHADLPSPDRGRCEVEVEVELSIGGYTRRGGFQTRQVSGSAGLLERSEAGGVLVAPVWRQYKGLKVRVRRPGAQDREPVPPRGSVRVATVAASGGLLTLGGEAEVGGELALVGPRGSTAWVPLVPAGGTFEVTLDLLVDEWGLGRTPLPADRYAVMHRDGSGVLARVALDRSLWRQLPSPIRDGDLDVFPLATDDGDLVVRVIPAEWRSSRPPYLRRRLREEVYPLAREKPLLDVALFETFAGKAAGDNPGALCREMAGRDDHGLELVFSVLDRSVEVPDGARAVVRFSAEYFELLGRARYLIVNASLPYFFRKREGQIYYQTWHGSPLKRIAHDRPHLDFFNWHHRRQLLVARDGWDCLLSQSEFCTRALRSAFRYDGPVMELGYPRNDLMVSDRAEDVRARPPAQPRAPRRPAGGALRPHLAGQPAGRPGLRQGALPRPARHRRAVPDAVVLVRGHYNSVQAAEDVDPDGRVIDVTRYPDIADLYVAADALVTDYSSVFFDFVLTDKPMVFLAPDLRGVPRRQPRLLPRLPRDRPGTGLPDHRRGGQAPLRAPTSTPRRGRGSGATFAPHDDGTSAARVVDAILELGARAAG